MSATSEQAPAGAGAGQPPRTGLLGSLQSLWKELPGLVGDRVDILSLELQRAGQALVQIIMLVVVLAILGVTAWLVIWSGVVAGLVALGLHIFWALLVVLALNALAAVLVLGHVRKLLKVLQFPATRRHLKPTPKPLRAPLPEMGPLHATAPQDAAAGGLGGAGPASPRSST